MKKSSNNNKKTTFINPSNYLGIAITVVILAITVLGYLRIQKLNKDTASLARTVSGINYAELSKNNLDKDEKNGDIYINELRLMLSVSGNLTALQKSQLSQIKYEYLTGSGNEDYVALSTASADPNKLYFQDKKDDDKQFGYCSSGVKISNQEHVHNDDENTDDHSHGDENYTMYKKIETGEGKSAYLYYNEKCGDALETVKIFENLKSY